MEYLSRFEKNLLQGLYCFDLVWGAPGIKHRFSYTQLRFLHDCWFWRSVQRWPADRANNATEPSMTRTDGKRVADRAVNRMTAQSVQLLIERGLLENKTANLRYFELQLTGAGIAMARRCNTFWGRAGLFYEEHHNGILGLFLTVAVSAVTSLITTYLRT